MYDKGKQPYIFHLTYIAGKFKELPEQTVALLHDIVEDTEYTLNDVRLMGYPEEIVAAVDAITKREGEAYEDYLKRVKANDIARRVKSEDLRHNIILERLGSRMKYTNEEWRIIMNRYQKYVSALHYLESTEENT
jgi:(p)ppGpp synthase/HD superfamily hydrolase